MQVKAAECRRIKNRFRQDETIGDDNRDIGLDRRKSRLLLLIAQ